MDGLKLGIASLGLGITGATVALIGGLTYGEIKNTAPIQQRIEEIEEIIGRTESQSDLDFVQLYSELEDLNHEAASLYSHNGAAYQTRFEFVLLAGGLSSAFLLTSVYLIKRYA